MSTQSSFGGRNNFAGLQGLASSQGLQSSQVLSSHGGAAGLQGMPSFGSQGQHGPAMESLTLTAQSVGLTVEQLAAALSSSPNLKALNPDSGNQDSQKELALSLYRTESLALYRRCMLLAGFDANAIEETSQPYLQFAFKAWQEEGKRLQDLMDAEVSLQAPGVANLNMHHHQQEAAQAHAHAQVQAQVQAQAVQAQAQALALEQQQQQKQQLLLQNRLQQQQSSGLKSLLYNQQRLSGMPGMQLLNNNKNQYL